MPNAVQLEKDGFWVTLWFNKPEKRNAFTADLLVELKQALVELRDDKSVRGITIRGRGGFFCAGGDLKMFKDTLAGGGERQAVIDTSCQIAEILDLVNTMPKLVVVLIEGAAMAGGFGLACCADVVICQNSAKFAMTETTLGLSPAQIAPFAIQKLGYSTARMLMLTAARFNGQESLAYGFANYTANTCEELEEIEQKLRDQLRNCGPEAIAATKDLLLKLPALDRNEAIDTAADNFTDCVLSDEAREGLSSFFDKSKPSWAKS